MHFPATGCRRTATTLCSRCCLASACSSLPAPAPSAWCVRPNPVAVVWLPALPSRCAADCLRYFVLCKLGRSLLCNVHAQAAPTAVMVGSGIAAAHGILIKVRTIGSGLLLLRGSSRLVMTVE